MGEKLDWGNVAAGMAMDATGSLINNLSNELQMERTFGFNERAAKNADARTRALFTDLYSPGAKVKQLKEAMGKVVKSNIAKREQAAARKAAEAAGTSTAEAGKTTV